MSTRDPPPGRAQFAEWFADLLEAVRDGTGIASVAVEDGRIAGLAYIRREDESLETRHVGVLSIEVLPELRGRGIGSALLEHALGRCPGRFELVKLEVLPGNEAGQRLYRKFGFQEHGRLPRGFYRAGTYHDFILMHRTIPPVP